MKVTVAHALGVAEHLLAMIFEAIEKISSDEITVSSDLFATPPKPEMGDVSFPCFPLVGDLGQNPAQVASRLAELIKVALPVTEVKAFGPYLNFFLDRSQLVATACQQVLQAGNDYGRIGLGKGKRVMIEYSGPNSNKALHLGHLRNNQLGLTLVRIFRAAGFEVVPVNIINDRGIAICQAMVTYRCWGEKETPQDAGVKGDHFVGQFYAQYQADYDEALAEWLLSEKGITFSCLREMEEDLQEELTDEFEAQSDLVAETVEMLKLWEANDPEIRALWETMNGWVYEGFAQTYARQGVHFDKVYFESDTYELGRDIVMEHLAKGTAVRDANDNIVIDLTDEGLDEKVLVRADGTTVYITQDIGTAVLRFDDYEPLDRLVYVVATEQCYHFRVLFKMLAKFGYSWANRCYHRSYGMVRLPSGKMSSRQLKQGGVFLADDLMDHLHELAWQEVDRRNPELPEAERDHRAELIGLAALKFYLLRVNADKDTIFQPEESLAFEGKTGPYLLYTYARIQSILRQAGCELNLSQVDLSLLGNDAELEVAKALMGLPQAVEQAVAQYNPTLIADWVYNLARAFNQFYNTSKVLGDQAELTAARLALSTAVAQALKNALELLGIDVLEQM